jgi:hypothetical protein
MWFRKKPTSADAAANANAQAAAGKTENSGKRRRIVDIIITVFCLCGASISFFIFWRDLNAAFSKQNETPVATIRFKQNTAQRRFEDRAIWDLLRQDSPIYSGDVIHTSALAEATIFFPDGEASVDVGENILLQIFASDLYTRIDLSSGVISVNGGNNGSKLILVTSGTEVDVGANSIVSASAGSSGGGLQVVKGSASVISKDGRREVDAGSTLSLDTAGRAYVSAVASMLSPAPSARYIIAGDETNIDFSWNTSNFGPNDFSRFQISTDQRFSNIVESADVHSANTRTVSIKPGIYWWRVYAVKPESEGEASELAISNKLLIVAAKTPEAIAPQANSTTPRRAAVHFRWSKDENPDSYLLQVAGNPQMQNPVLMEDVRGDSYTYEGLGEGTWYWQVRAMYSTGWEGAASVYAASRPSMFNIAPVALELSAPILSLPGNAAYINTGGDAKSVLFSWKNDNSAVNYTLEIADNFEFNNPLLVKTLNGSNYYSWDPSIPPVKEGLYFWRVRGSDGDGVMSPPSDTRYFNAVENLIVFENVFPPDNYSVNETRFEDVRFQWNSNLESPSHFQLARDSSFSTILIDETTTETALQISGRTRLAAGDYYWRITSAFDGKDVETSVRRLTIQGSSRIALESPPSGAEIDGLSALRGETLIKWGSNEPVLNTRLIVLRNGSFVFEQQNPGRELTLPSLSAGDYTWTIQAETMGGFDISPEIPSSFRVAPIPRLPAATGLSPAPGKKFGAEELRGANSINFLWNRVPGANAYIFRLYHAGNSAPAVSTRPLRTPAYTISDLTTLDAGGFTWQVEALFLLPNGEIAQRGDSAESQFLIDINVPSAPKLPDKETYGLPAPQGKS